MKKERDGEQDRDPEEEGSAAKQPQPRETRRDQDPEEEGSAGRPER